MATVSERLQAAIALSPTDRMELADLLFASVSDDDRLPMGDCPLSDEWLEEIRYRAAEIDAGRMKLFTWEEVRDRAFKRHSSGE
jgi:putative addiction module component (TIGR02574 family)